MVEKSIFSTLNISTLNEKKTSTERLEEIKANLKSHLLIMDICLLLLTALANIISAIVTQQKLTIAGLIPTVLLIIPVVSKFFVKKEFYCYIIKLKKTKRMDMFKFLFLFFYYMNHVSWFIVLLTLTLQRLIPDANLTTYVNILFILIYVLLSMYDTISWFFTGAQIFPMIDEREN